MLSWWAPLSSIFLHGFPQKGDSTHGKWESVSHCKCTPQTQLGKGAFFVVYFVIHEIDFDIHNTNKSGPIRCKSTD